MGKIFILILLVFLQSCKQKTPTSQFKCKEVLKLEYGVNSSFGFSKDTILISSWAGKMDKANSTYWVHGPSTGLFKPQYDTILKEQDFNKNFALSEKIFKKTIKQNSEYINNIYTTRFKYDVIIYDTFNIHTPSGGPLAYMVLNKPESSYDTASLKYKFAKKENIEILKIYNNYYFYFSANNKVGECYKSLNVFNIATKQKCQIRLDFSLGITNFLIFDIMDNETPEIIIFHTPIFTFRDIGTLKIFKIIG